MGRRRYIKIEEKCKEAGDEDLVFRIRIVNGMCEGGRLNRADGPIPWVFHNISDGKEEFFIEVEDDDDKGDKECREGIIQAIITFVMGQFASIESPLSHMLRCYNVSESATMTKAVIRVGRFEHKYNEREPQHAKTEEVHV